VNLLNTQLKGDRVLAGKEAVAELYKTAYFGRPRDDGLELSLVEAAYLQSRGKIDIELEGEPLDFRAFFEQSLDGVVLIDKQGVLIGWNKTAEEITNLQQADTLAQRIWDDYSSH